MAVIYVILGRHYHGYGVPTWVMGMGQCGYGCGFEFYDPHQTHDPQLWVWVRCDHV